MDKELRNIDIDLIKPNPDNPRIIFRQEEMDSLLISAKEYGILVPISVYKEGNHFVIIDGERRWRVSKKLNLSTIPAIIQEKPTPLDNLLMMFNIHALREQWDLFTIANKITKVIELLNKKLGHKPNEIQLSEETGLSRGTIRRCRLLIELPDRFKNIILKELEKPKLKQKLTEDFFIEMEGALKTVRRNFPETIKNIEIVRDSLIKKFEKGIIKSLRDFKLVGKIATSSKNVSYPDEEVVEDLTQIFYDETQSIDGVYNSTVSVLYDERKLISNFSNALYYIQNLTDEERNDEDIKRTLIKLKFAIEEILGDNR
jgi:ParB/RepB/Spo0J family partition protein